MPGTAEPDKRKSGRQTVTINGDNFTVYTEGDPLYDDMVAAIEAARQSVCLESYIFENDATGARFVEALCERARSGVDVKLHLDALGSLGLMFSNAPKQLRSAGVALRWFNPPRFGRLFKLNRRNHRKLLVVDGDSAWLGGFNIHDECSRRQSGDIRWRDTQVQLAGTLARRADEFFHRLWRGQRQWRLPFEADAPCFLVSNHNFRQTHRFRRLLKRAMHSARNRIWLTTPYFMPDQGVQSAMAEAARRGVDVRLLVPFKTDRPVTQWAARAAYSELLAAGVRIYEYEPRVLHAKTAIVDEHWCTVGTANLDYRSFFVNFELNLIARMPELAAVLAENFREDLRQANRVRRHTWKRRPLRMRLAELIGWAARKYL